MVKAPVLIVEDESDIADLIEYHLKREGYITRVVGTGAEALRQVARDRPALILLDLMMPEIDGLEVCRRLKGERETREIPIIMVTARGEESDIVVGLELGADDYITKPFAPRVLMARVKTVMRRTEPKDVTHMMLAGGAITIDAHRHTVHVDGQEAELTLTQFRLLQFLAQRAGFVRTRDQMVSAVRGEGAVLSSRVIDVHIAALRQKLGEYGDLIETVRGVGYRLTDARVPESA